MARGIDRRRFLKAMSLLPLLSTLGGEGHVARAPVEGQADAGTPNVIVLLFDTLSARHLGLHGYHRNTAPNLARFAERATVYHRHYSAGNFTTPGTASLLTGTYPWTHRALHHSGIVIEKYAPRNLVRFLDATHTPILYPHNLWADLLVQQFRADGDRYLPPGEFSLADLTFPDRLFARDADIAFRSFEDLLFRRISLPGSLFLSLANKLQIDLYSSVRQDLADLYPRGVPSLGIYPVFFLLEQVIDGIQALLDGVRQPFLAYLHLFPPHEPYCPRREFVGVFADGWTPVAKPPHPLGAGRPQAALDRWRTEYDEYIAFVDAEFGRLLSFLEERGFLDDGYLVITSDHGQLFERGVHGHDTDLLYEPVIHVPLLISRPGQQQREDVNAPTSSVDLLPTLLDALGRPIPAWCEGQVLPATRGEEAGSSRAIYAVEAKRNAAHQPLHTGTVALIRDRYKLIHYLGNPGFEDTFELYDLVSDPDELENLYTSRGSIAGDLQRELAAKLGEVNQPYFSQR